MTDQITFDVPDRGKMKPCIDWVFDNLQSGLARGPAVVTIGRPKRTLEQNSKQWPMLQDICNTLPEWGGLQMTKEYWKQVLTAAWNEQKFLPGINGGVVGVGVSTSKLNKEDFSELIELYYEFGSRHDVKWSEKSLEIYETYKEAG